MLNPIVIERILTAALTYGGDFSEVYIERTKSSSLSAVNGIIESASTGIELGVGIRVLKGIRSVYVFSNDLSEKTLIRLAENASRSLSENPEARHVSLNPMINYHSSKPITLPLSVAQKTKADILRLASSRAKAYHEIITQTSSSYSDMERNILIANSEGDHVTDQRVRTRFMIDAVATLGEEKQTGYFAPGGNGGFEFVESLPIETLADDAARIAVTMAKAGPCPSGRFPVVIGNGFGGVIFHEACGHALEASSVGIGASVFAGKLGMQIASNVVTAIDDPTMAGEWGSFEMDDEAVVPERHVLIQDGVLKGYLIDRIGARRMNTVPNGAGRRQNYKFAPTSRMSNTFIDAGSDTKEQIIADTPFGIYAANMGGGSVDPSTGEFNFAVTEAYMIRDGKLAEPVRGATLIGKGHEILLNIDRVGNDRKFSQGMCGSYSGNVPTNVGQPTIRVSEITVGGQKDDL
ncbi:MAG: TldD/PmbA family protein [Clostridiales bacterium]|nr:TldD/PmbA family protein [Clostridiales bacterium]